MDYINLKKVDELGINRQEAFRWYLEFCNVQTTHTNYPSDFTEYILKKDREWCYLKCEAGTKWFVDNEYNSLSKDMTDTFLVQYNKVNLSKLQTGGWIELRCGDVYEVERVVNDGRLYTVCTYDKRQSTQPDIRRSTDWNHTQDGTWHGETNSAGDIIKIHPPGAYVSKRIGVEPSFLQEDPVDTINHFDYVEKCVEIYDNFYIIKGMSQDYDEDIVLTLEDIVTKIISYHLVPSKSELEFKLYMKNIIRENQSFFFGQKALDTIKDSNQETKPDIKTDNVKSAVEDVIKTILNL